MIVDLQPARGLRRRRPLPRQRRGALAAARRARRRVARGAASRTSTSTTTTAPSPHLFHVACRPRLDGRRRGPDPRPGPRRAARRPGARHRRPALNALFQQALRVGKRAHAETDIDRAAPSLVTRGARARPPRLGGSPGAASLVVGAGSMAVARRRDRLPRWAPPSIVVVNRTARQRRAARRRVRRPRRCRSADLADALADADLVVSCTGAAGVVITPRRAGRRRARGRDDAARRSSTSPCRTTSTRPSPSCPASPSSTSPRWPTSCATPTRAASVEGVRAIVAEEVAAFLAARRQASVTPTVVALRSMATGGRRRRAGAPRRPAARPRRRPPAPRSRTPCAGSPTSCCTSRPCGSRSSPTTSRRRVLRRGAGRALRPRPRRRRRRRPAPACRGGRHERLTAPCASAPARSRAGHHPVRARRRR